MENKKPASIFDLLSNITDKKVSWYDLSEQDRKTFSPYMINRFLSMNMDFIELVNELQRYTVGQLSTAETYKLYFDVLPKQKQYNKYIKGKKSETYKSELIDLIANHYQISTQESMEYLDLFFDDRLNFLKEIIKKYGKSDKECEKLLKLEK
jgi:hypothetical protein